MYSSAERAPSARVVGESRSVILPAPDNGVLEVGLVMRPREWAEALVLTAGLAGQCAN